jgi:hypothetical protein
MMTGSGHNEGARRASAAHDGDKPLFDVLE